MGGRPRKPTAIKRLQGTLQKCRMPKDEPLPEGDLKLSAPPDYLTDTAKNIWSYALDQAPPGLLTNLDLAVFSRWVVLYDQFLQLSAALKKDGTVQESEDGTLTVNPMIRAINLTAQTLRGIETELGFTPASRTRISVKRTTAEPVNTFEGF